MSELAEADRDALRAVLRRCGDDTLGRVSTAVGEMFGARAAEFRAILSEEFRDRSRRAFVFAPLRPMFRPRRDGIEALIFPACVLPRLWRLASARELHLLSHLDGEDHVVRTDVADRICQAAASVARDQPQLVWPGDIWPANREAGLRDLAACLDISHLARRALPSLETWLKRPDGDQLAELRLLINDSAAVHPDGARRLVEILFAHLEEAALVVRLVTKTSGPAKHERFLSASEFSDFVERLLAGVHSRARRIEAYVPQLDAGELQAVLGDLMWCAETLGEIDVTLELDASSDWGKTVRTARLALSHRLAKLISASEAAVDKALPLERVRIAGRMTRMVPLSSAPLAGQAWDEALALLRLIGAIRGVAGAFGCEAARGTAVETLSLRLTDYTDQLLGMIHDQEVPDEEHALGLIEAAALLLEALGAQGPARTVRRRAAAAGGCTSQGGLSYRAA